MRGWILHTSENIETSREELIGEDGRTYRIGKRPSGETSVLPPEQEVRFQPLAGPDGLPFASDIREENTETDPLVSLRAVVRGRLSEKRYVHSFRVSKIARALAERAGCSAFKAEAAGLLHDIAKELPDGENVRLVQEGDLSVSGFETGYHHILHALAGSVIANRDLSIGDREILDAIRYHNGRPAMGPVEKAVFIADHIDRLHRWGEKDADSLLDAPSLDDAIFRLILKIDRYYVARRQVPDAITECTMNYMLQSIGRSEQEGIAEDPRSGVTDEQFDEALRISARQSVGVRSVPNCRHLGGYRSDSGKTVRGGCLVRSARLSDMSDEDAQALRSFGVDTVIDLRSDREVAEHPDRDTGIFRFCRCPLPTIETDTYLQQIGEKFASAPAGKEKTFYLAEYLSCLSMEDMYLDALTADSSLVSLRKVFSILLDPGTRGVLFHCTSGKDRTGIVAALILLVLGVGMQDIRSDYYTSVLTTFVSTENMAQSLRKEHYAADIIDEIRYYNGVGNNIAEETYHRVLKKYGSAQAYLTDALGLTGEMQQKLREKYLF